MGGYDFANRSQSEAWAWCWLASITFVVSLYLVPARLRRLPRSDPAQIKARLTAVSCTTFVTVVVTCLLAQPERHQGGLLPMAWQHMHSLTCLDGWMIGAGIGMCAYKADGGMPLRRWIGLGAERLWAALAFPLLLVCCLFLGPLATLAWMSHKLARHEVTPYGLSRPRAHPLPWHVAVGAELANKANLTAGAYGAIRNLVVGPIAEEVVFRGCSVAVLLGAGVSRPKIMWLSPLLFGFAHLHHALEWLRQGHPVSTVAAGVLFQIAYTSIFGSFAVFVQLRTGHLASSIVVHMLCNYMSVPDITFSIAPGNPRESTRTSVLYEHRKGLWCFYGVGICLFVGMLRPLTSPSLYGSVLWRPGASHS